MQIPDAYICRMAAAQPEIELLITFFKSKELKSPEGIATFVNGLDIKSNRADGSLICSARLKDEKK